jgi:hypothetical protein
VQLRPPPPSDPTPDSTDVQFAAESMAYQIFFGAPDAAPAGNTAPARATKYIVELPSGNWRFEVPAGTQVASVITMLKIHPRTREFVKGEDVKSAAAWAVQQKLSVSAASLKVCADHASQPRVETKRDLDIAARLLDHTTLVPADVKKAFDKELKIEMDKLNDKVKKEAERNAELKKKEEERKQAVKTAWKGTIDGLMPEFKKFIKDEKEKWKQAGASAEEMEDFLSRIGSGCKEECQKLVPQTKKRKIDGNGAGPAM